MISTNSRTVKLSVLFYSLLVNLYPENFRNAYGELMIQLFRDRCLTIYQNKSSLGLSRLWASTLVDFFLTVLEQYENRGVMMTKSSWIKITGWFLTTSSLFFLIGFIASSRPKYSEYNFLSEPIDKILNRIGAPFLLIGMLLVTIGVIGLISQFRNKADNIGKVGLGFALFGGLLSSVSFVASLINDVSPWWELTIIGSFLLFLGVCLFGINCLKAKLFYRWNAIPFIIGLPWTVAILTYLLMNSVLGSNFEIPNIFAILILILSFGGISVVGYMLFSEKNKIEPKPA